MAGVRLGQGGVQVFAIIKIPICSVMSTGGLEHIFAHTLSTY